MWQSIETAPTDGTWVILTGGTIIYGWEGNDLPPVVCAQYSGRVKKNEIRWHFAWYDGGYYGEYVGPTHWMPVQLLSCEKIPLAKSVD